MPTVEVGVMKRLSLRPKTESSAPLARRSALTRKPLPASSRRLSSRRWMASLPTAKMRCAPVPVSSRAPAPMRVASVAGWPYPVTAPFYPYTAPPAGSGCGRRPKNCAPARPTPPAASTPAASARSRNARLGSSASPNRLVMDASLSRNG
jgi:hypothetical protein